MTNSSEIGHQAKKDTGTTENKQRQAGRGNKWKRLGETTTSHIVTEPVDPSTQVIISNDQTKAWARATRRHGVASDLEERIGNILEQKHTDQGGKIQERAIFRSSTANTTVKT